MREIKEKYYLLIRWNGQSPGKAPNTRLAWVEKVLEKSGEPLRYKVITRKSDGTTTGPWAKTSSVIDASKVVQSWTRSPSFKEIILAKKNLAARERDNTQ